MSRFPGSSVTTALSTGISVWFLTRRHQDMTSGKKILKKSWVQGHAPLEKFYIFEQFGQQNPPHLLLQWISGKISPISLRVSHLPTLPEGKERDPRKGWSWASQAKWEHYRGVVFNGEICWVELCQIQGIMLWPPLTLMFNSSPQPAIRMVFIWTSI